MILAMPLYLSFRKSERSEDCPESRNASKRIWIPGSHAPHAPRNDNGEDGA